MDGQFPLGQRRVAYGIIIKAWSWTATEVQKMAGAWYYYARSYIVLRLDVLLLPYLFCLRPQY